MNPLSKETIIKEIILSPKAKIRDAASVIQKQPIKVILVCDESKRLLGTVTDGDIRRSIVDGLDYGAPVDAIMNTSPMVTKVHEAPEDIKRRMRESVIRHLPEIDGEGKVTNIYCLDDPDVSDEMPNAVVIMAGGRGERLYPLTKDTPKPMLEVGGKPVLERAIEALAAQGFRRFYISINYLGHLIEEYFGDGDRLGVKIAYLRESKPLGTAGSLHGLRQSQIDFPFVVMNGDLLTTANLRPMVDLCQDNVTAVIGAREYSYTVPYGCLTLSGGNITSIKEKPTIHHFINAGLYVFSPVVLEYLDINEHIDMPILLKKIFDAGLKVNHHHITEDWIDIGSTDDLDWARKIYRDKES